MIEPYSHDKPRPSADVVRKWTCEQLLTYLGPLLGKHRGKFRESEVSGSAFLDCNLEILKDTELPLGPRLDLFKVITEINREPLPKRRLDEADAPSTAKRTVSDAHPEGLGYKPPKEGALLYSDGSKWQYQPDPNLYTLLQSPIKEQYEKFKTPDKTTMPIYLFFSAAGTGKSRNALEFQQSAINCLDDADKVLKDKLRDAWVFHTSFENGSGLLHGEEEGYRAIGMRMLWQLCPEEWLTTLVDRYNAPHPEDVLALVAKAERRELKDVTVILVVDGLHRLITNPHEDAQNKTSNFYKTFTALGDLMHKKFLLLPCCTATILGPIEGFLAHSVRRRVYLPVASLNPPNIVENGTSCPVFDMKHLLTRIFVEDCGGHGRAIEILSALMKTFDLKDGDVGLLMRSLRTQLNGKYGSGLFNKNTAKAIVKAVFTHRLYRYDEPVSNTESTAAELAAPGLVRFECKPNSTNGYLSVPYIWLMIMEKDTKENGASVLGHWDLEDHNDIASKNDSTLPGMCRWQNFEVFNAQFRSLKSYLFDEKEEVKLSSIHHGAYLRGDVKFKNHHLSVVMSKNQTDSKTSPQNPIKWLLDCGDEIDVRKHQHIILNAASAPSGDAFLSLDTQPAVNEVHQYKYLESSAGYDYHAERNKAASTGDFFILFTNDKQQKVTLKQNCGLVNGENWRDYFGPFAGRAYLYREQGPLNINTSGFTTLQLAKGIGKVSATKIVKERNKRNFSSIEDAEKRTGIKRECLEQYSCD